MTNRYVHSSSLVGIAIASTMLCAPSMTWGGTATADAFLPTVGAPLGGAATYELRAFSVQFTPVPSGPNAVSFNPAAIIDFKPIVFLGLPPRFYLPSYFATGPATTLFDVVTSASGGGGGKPFGAIGQAVWDPGAAAPVAPLRASATILPLPVTGAAAGQAQDPYQLSAGVYQNYSYTVDNLTLKVDPSNPTEFVGASYFATDSRYSQPLWSLAVSTEGVLNSRSDLQITFESNPILGLDDTLIEDEVRAAFTVNSGTATLTSFELFDTTYKVSQTIQYSEGVNAEVGAGSVPEPSSVILLSSGSLILFGIPRLVRHRRSRFAPTVSPPAPGSAGRLP
jgi:hypothetical protein